MNFKTIAAMVLTLALCAGAGCNGKKQDSQAVSGTVDTTVAAQSARLATIAEQDAPVAQQGITAQHTAPSPGQAPEFTVFFSSLGKGEAYLTSGPEGACVVHNGARGKVYQGVGGVALSRDGRRIAYGAVSGGQWRMVDNGAEGETFNEVGDPVFSPDGRHLAYEALTGKHWHVVVDGRISDGVVQYYQKPVFSADGSKILLIENTEQDGLFRLVVSDLGLVQQSRKEMRMLGTVVSKNLTQIATVQQDGAKYRVLRFSFAAPDQVSRGADYDAISDLSFSPDGASLAYLARRGTTRLLVLDGKEEPLPDGGIMAAPAVRPDRKGAGVILATNAGYLLHEGFAGKSRHKLYADAGDLTYSSNGDHAYVAVTGNEMRLVVNDKEGPLFDRVVSPVFSPDGRFVVYRARKEGKRFVVVADLQGRTVRRHPSYEMVFETTFTSDGKSVAYGVKSGRELWWKVEPLDSHDKGFGQD
ncbi:TolB family protein [Geomonas paludis]|uniref:Lipoprotein n=1 Tax=Geomonas paludis TaxID=2740185 RepID=A0A6V8N0U6_9BACT|nr:PD40 domain-containing protein [Geomonas paludis]GFO66095.1 hypothetical protein GMPD_40140 [Geomonas paludis]